MPEALLRRWFEPLLEWLSLPRCAACGVALPSKYVVFCALCEVSVTALARRLPPSWPGELASDHRIAPLARGDPVHAGYLYGGALASAIRRYKYGGHLELARPLGRLLSALIPQSRALVVTVPPSASALRLRGFDHVQQLVRAAGDAALRSRQVPPGTMVRVGRRPPQASLALRERRALPVSVFQVRKPRRMSGQPVVLVDDVMTTGATLAACAEALRRAGAEVVARVTLAAVP